MHVDFHITTALTVSLREVGTPFQQASQEVGYWSAGPARFEKVKARLPESHQRLDALLGKGKDDTA